MTCAVSNEDIVSSSLKAYASNGMLHVSGLQAGISLRIYNLAGQLIYSGTAKAAEEHISLATQGVYVVVAGEESTKVYVDKGE